MYTTSIQPFIHRNIRFLWTLLVLVLPFLHEGSAMAQTITMQNGQTIYAALCANGADIYDDGGPSGNYSNSFQGWVVLTTNAGATITLTGNYNTENSYDYLSIYDGETQILRVCGTNSLNVVATSGTLKIHFSTDGSVVRQGFSLHAVTSAPPTGCNSTVHNLAVSNLNATSGTLTWDGSGENLMLDYGAGPIAVSGNSYDLTGLVGSTDYTISLYAQADSGETCCTSTLHITTPIQGGHGCIDPSDLTAPYVQGYYGSFSSPYSSIGIINHGPSDAYSRHTVHTNPNERDPRTGNLLSTVPPGGTSSVRLGNWRTGSEAEALLYAIEVDTMLADLLILKYAAVLEDPNHSPSEQPRFRLEILNGNMEVIDPTCGVADFISNSNLGWNTHYSTLWKDWTTVGIDLTPYAGQTILVRLTTYDCSQSGHYGYAYFTLECSRKNMASETCGANASNTFTVPEGFSYLWYTDSPQSPISTARSINVTSDTGTIYHCLLSFVDKPACNFTMSAFAGVRYPLALFDSVVTMENCEFDVSFVNRSTISADGVTPSGTGESCEASWWSFGNGDTSSLYHATAHYDAPGQYEVVLVSSIANGLCTDTIRKTITLMPPGPNPSITGPTDRCDNSPVNDTLIVSNALWHSWNSDTLVVSPTATTTYTLTAQDTSHCPYTLNHTITVHPTYDLHDTAVICPSGLPYSYGSLVIADATDTGSYSYSELSSFGCDSIGTVFLVVKDTSMADTVAVACDRFVWYGTEYTTSGAVAHRVTTNAVGCDSTTTLLLTVNASSTSSFYDTVVENLLPHTFNGTTFSHPASDTTVTIVNAAGCDSTISYSLHVHWNVDTTLYDTLCRSALPYTWNNASFDTTLSASATMTRATTFLSHTGSDSLVTMLLTVHPLYDHHLTTAICDDTVFAFGDSLFSVSTDYTDSLLSIRGCDSLSSLHLTVHPTFDHHTYDTICSNQSIVFTQHTYNTSGDYAHQLLSRHSCDSLSTLHLTVWPAYDYHTYDTLCDDSSRLFIDSTYRQTGTFLHHLFSAHSCDSLQTLHLKVYPTYNIHLYDTIYDGDTYTFEHTLYDTTGIYPHLLQAVFGCDSLRTLHLQRNRRTYVDSILCQNSLPLVWNGAVFANGNGLRSAHRQTMADSVHLQGLDGIDSLVVMRVVAIDTSATLEQLHACDSLTWLDGISYTASTSAPFLHLTNQWGCDSIHHLDLTVDSTHLFTDRHMVCDSMRWLDNTVYHADIQGPQVTLVTYHGCDSIVTLDLAVHYSSYEESADTFCHGQTYRWHSFSVSGDSAYLNEDHLLLDTLHSVYACDSVLALRLTKMAQPRIDFSYSTDCLHRTYTISATSSVPYTRWSSYPMDSQLDGNEDLLTVTVAPSEPTEYSLYADYRDIPFCPFSKSIVLSPVDVPKAELQVNPGALKYNAMDYTAYDISKEYVERTWYVDGVRQSEPSRILYGRGDDHSDTIAIALSVYNGQCLDTAFYLLPVLRVAVFAPNAFTPNLETNNRFTIVTQGVIDGELFIYNREGLLMYQTTDFGNMGWDGGNCPQGNYVWRFNYHAVDYPNSPKSEIGTVLLIR